MTPPYWDACSRSKVILQWLHLELQAAQDTGRRALPLVPAEAVWERADLLIYMAATYYLRGRFADADALLPEVERVTSRARDPRGPFYRHVILSDRDVMRTGDLRAFLARTEHMLVGSFPGFRLFSEHRWPRRSCTWARSRTRWTNSR